MKSLFKFIKRIILFILILILAISSIIVYKGYTMYKDAIAKCSIADKISEIKSSSDYLSIKYIPKTYQQATIAVEDHRFYEHHGFDFITTLRALIENIQNKDITNGGSTITQQVAKNLYFSQEKSFMRKVAELFVAVDLEKKYSKDEILEIYLNIIYFGDGYTGISQASYGYFEKNPNSLSLSEQTLLAGIPNAPSIYSPTSNLELSKQRQNQVINAMIKYGYISKDEANKI